MSNYDVTSNIQPQTSNFPQSTADKEFFEWLNTHAEEGKTYRTPSGCGIDGTTYLRYRNIRKATNPNILKDMQGIEMKNGIRSDVVEFTTTADKEFFEWLNTHAEEGKTYRTPSGCGIDGTTYLRDRSIRKNYKNFGNVFNTKNMIKLIQKFKMT